MIDQTAVDKSLENKMDWDAHDTFRILSTGKEVVASFLDTHHIYYTDGKDTNSIRIDLVERIKRRKKAIIAPVHEPQGRTPKERYLYREILSTDFRYFGPGNYYHYGPYVALWEDKYAVSNPEPMPPHGTLEYHQWSAYLDNEWVVTRHDEDANEFDVLLRTTDKQEALVFFCALEGEYPQGVVPHNRAKAPHSHGGAREGSGRKNELGETKYAALELPVEFVKEIDEQAVRESELAGRKVSRAEMIRRRLGLER